jgi:hemin uptake protein HemP
MPKPNAFADRTFDERKQKSETQLVLAGPALPSVRSEDLFGIGREILIEHSGAYYHLRLTRANKLILTK